MPHLIYRLADQWVAAGSDLDAVPGLLSELPGPNLAALRVLVRSLVLPVIFSFGLMSCNVY